MKMNAFTTQLKKELMDEYVRVSEEVNKGHMTADDALQAVTDEADELFDTCLDQQAMLEASGKDFDMDLYGSFELWLLGVIVRFNWDSLCKLLESEREAA